ncbi:MAG: hypothetical protein AAGB00_01820 [Planctomycetota bacterium]
MVTPDNLIDLLVREPFKPFVMRLNSGEERLVRERRHAATGRNASRCTIVTESGGFETIRFADIAELIGADTATNR